MNQIEELLKRTIGLHAPTVGSSLIEHAVEGRMRHHGLGREGDYLRLIENSPAEWEALVEAVVVTETWFFRDREPFRAMINLVERDWLPKHRLGSLRLLSVPCSTGDEAYSMAISLIEAGIPENRFHIDAIDISPAAIGRAQRAVYGKNSFRGRDLTFRDRHFQPVDKFFSLNQSVRQKVDFEIANILDPQCLAGRAPYDFIFCRNLLIYFDVPTQERVLRKINTLLASNGVLFVGSAELPIAIRSGFVSAKLPLGFACRKAPPESLTARRRRTTLSARIAANPAPSKIEPLTVASPTRSAPFERSSTADLSRARELADAGQLDEAAAICERHLREHGVSAEAYYLLGLVRDAAGAESQAGEFYRKALYLEPDHYETLLHWASLSLKIGDSAHARILNERAQRVRNQN
jgi:chemotaxis protein methyltransferase WspC